MRRSGRHWIGPGVIVVLALGLVGCGALGGGSKPADAAAGGQRGARPVVVEMPWETTAVRDNENAPMVKVVNLDNGAGGVPVPYLYGYPIYGQGEALKGILKLRTDNQEGAEVQEQTDDHGVVVRVESLPQLGCTIEGVQENATKFVPTAITCSVPAPKSLGGKARPVIGALKAGARAKEVVEEPSLAAAFLGDWHLVEGNPDAGDGIGYFNTDHGQLAFRFDDGKLSAVAYYFDPPHAPWQNAMLWATP